MHIKCMRDVKIHISKKVIYANLRYDRRLAEVNLHIVAIFNGDMD